MKLSFFDKTNDGVQFPPYVTVDIPLTIHFGYQSQTLSDYKDELAEVLEIKTGQTFDIIAVLGNLLADNDFGRTDLMGEYIALMTEFGKGLEEAIGMTREFFEANNPELAEKEANKPKTEPNILDLSS